MPLGEYSRQGDGVAAVSDLATDAGGGAERGARLRDVAAFAFRCDDLFCLDVALARAADSRLGLARCDFGVARAVEDDGLARFEDAEGGAPDAPPDDWTIGRGGSDVESGRSGAGGPTTSLAADDGEGPSSRGTSRPPAGSGAAGGSAGAAGAENASGVSGKATDGGPTGAAAEDGAADAPCGCPTSAGDGTASSPTSRSLIGCATWAGDGVAGPPTAAGAIPVGGDGAGARVTGEGAGRGSVGAGADDGHHADSTARTFTSIASITFATRAGSRSAT
jgi:hypothetical protein